MHIPTPAGNASPAPSEPSSGQAPTQAPDSNESNPNLMSKETGTQTPADPAADAPTFNPFDDSVPEPKDPKKEDTPSTVERLDSLAPGEFNEYITPVYEDIEEQQQQAIEAGDIQTALRLERQATSTVLYQLLATMSQYSKEASTSSADTARKEAVNSVAQRQTVDSLTAEYGAEHKPMIETFYKNAQRQGFTENTREAIVGALTKLNIKPKAPEVEDEASTEPSSALARYMKGKRDESTN